MTTDLRYPNAVFASVDAVLPTAGGIGAKLRPRTLIGKADCTKAYHQVAVPKAASQYLVICWKGVLLYYRVLPSG